jgi:tripartite-type tricarboxylate transporter receptor subunit TctC
MSDTRVVLVALLSLLGAAAAPALGQGTFPSKPVTFVVPTSPGGPTDREARFYVQKLYENTGQPFLLDFKAGARANIGNMYVVKSAPDGYTLLLTSSGFPVFPALNDDMPYDTIRDFVPVSMLSKRMAVLLLHPSVPVNTFPDYLAYARANAAKLNYGTAGAGAITHIAGAWLMGITNTRLTMIHYKGGGPMITDLVAGRVQVSAAPLTTTLSFIRAGKLKAVASMNSTRAPQFPDMKTVAEQGYPDFDYPGWLGVLAPAKTPPAIVSKLNAEINRAVTSPEIVKALEPDGVIAIASTPEAFAKVVATEVVRWKKVVKDNDIKAEE